MHFMLCAECGPDQGRGLAVAAHFDQHPLPSPGGAPCLAGAWARADGEGNHWAELEPSGPVGHALSAAARTAIGLALYERLRTAPPFRYALVGLEVQEFGLRSELTPKAVTLSGRVLSDALAAELSGVPGGVTFAPGYMWTPWRGDDWGA